MNNTIRHLLLCIGIACSGFGDSLTQETVVLENGVVELTVKIHGGALSGYTFKNENLNPFNWRAKRWPGDVSSKEGFFLCFDRLGFPSEEEKSKGMPLHGEATSVDWKVLKKTDGEEGQTLLMQCDLPIARMSVIREYRLFPGSSACRITDRFKNNNPFEKAYNILHHPSMGPPFLDETVLVDCNASAGFINSKKVDALPGPTVFWPEVEYQGRRINLHLMKDGQNITVNYRCEESALHGWGCVASPSKRMLVGILWNTSEYPWTRIWREWAEGTPTALGIEFGTSPLGIPFEEIGQVGNIMGFPTLHTLAPGGEIQTSFYLFISRIPDNFSGIESITLENHCLKLKERTEGAGREINLHCGTP